MGRTIFVIALTAALAVSACESTSGVLDTHVADVGTGDATADTGGGEAHWYTTCGDPVCRGYTPPVGVAECTAAQIEGASCPTAGETCDPKSDCDSLLLCATKDPKQQTGGCPISRRAVKQDVVYLDDAALRRVTDAVLSMPLATWRYRDAPEARQLGFVLEDVTPNPAADEAHDRVNLYAFTTMAVAALRVQHAELATLRQRVEELQARADAAEGSLMCR